MLTKFSPIYYVSRLGGFIVSWLVLKVLTIFRKTQKVR